MQDLVSQNQTTSHSSNASQEFLVFTLGDEQYGIDILKVREIRGYENVTTIANTPDFIKGVINLRGVIVPVIDLRIKFALEMAEYGDQTVMIIVDIGDRIVGMVVDSVSDVMTLTADQIKPAPTMGMSLSSDYIAGLGSIEDRMIVLMDVDALLTSREMAAVAQQGSASAIPSE